MNPTMSSAGIDSSWTINQIVERHPETLPVLDMCSLDTCCGGAHALGVAAERHGLDLDALLTALRAVAALRAEPA